MKLYNTLTKSVGEFVPQEPNVVKIYSCGVTTYDEMHLGHARQAAVFDVLRNYLEYLGYNVIYVRNFTDIDDKIIRKAYERKRDPLELSSYYVEETVSDLHKIKVENATFQPKVTEHITEIINLIGSLIDKGYAYVANGEVLFSIDKFKDYGKLSGRNVQDLISADDSPNKQKPYDFALWKPNKAGEPFWDSPWGPGRPGWHIECSAMAKRYLGETVDIHGGGIDLVFPHHENEIAQSEAANEKPLARYWMHNGLVNVNGQKMSKSLGNFYTIKDMLKKYTADEIRMAVLVHGYSTPIDFSDDLFLGIRKRSYSFYKVLARISQFKLSEKDDIKIDDNKYKDILNLEANFRDAMDDNLNTPRVIANLSAVFTKLNNTLEDPNNREKEAVFSIFMKQFKTVTSVLKILDEGPVAYINSLRETILKERGITAEEIEGLIKERKQVKKEKNYQRSDEIKDQLLKYKINIQDKKDDITWDVDFS